MGKESWTPDLLELLRECAAILFAVFVGWLLLATLQAQVGYGADTAAPSAWSELPR
jgi:hypothetical protein